MDLNRCSKCGLSLIEEEILNHKCKTVIDYKFEDDILWLFDGEIWYPRKLLHRNFTGQQNNRRFDSSQITLVSQVLFNSKIIQIYEIYSSSQNSKLITYNFRIR